MNTFPRDRSSQDFNRQPGIQDKFRAPTQQYTQSTPTPQQYRNGRFGLSDQKSQQRQQPSGPGVKSREQMDDKSGSDEDSVVSKKDYAIGLGRDVLIAFIVMAIVIGSLFWYTGNWPPMVVIESNSMMHGEDSSVGTIDTGDLVLVKDSGRGDITTYVEGQKSGYKTYGTYGDVIIFRKNGMDDTPVIHRAVVWLEYNASGSHFYKNNGIKVLRKGSFDIPSMGKYNETKIWINDYKPNRINLSIDLVPILSNLYNSPREPHSGYLTKGDKNSQVDQLSTLLDAKGRPVEPITSKWVVGKAQGELPWFGLIKLFISGETDQPNKSPPQSSVNMLILSIALIVAIPIILDVTFSMIGKRKKKAQADKEKKESQQAGPPRYPLAKPVEKPEDDSKGIPKDDLLRRIK
jgi:signal peptidase